MFEIVHQDLGHKGEMRLSTSYGGAQIVSRTRGIGLKYVTRGTEYYVIEGNTIKVGAGSFIVVPEGVRFKALANDELTTGICIDLNSSIVETLVSGVEEFDTHYAIPVRPWQYNLLGRSICQMSGLLKEGAHSSLIDGLYTNFTEFNKTVFSMQTRLNGTYKKLRSRQDVLSRLLLARDYIHLNYQNRISLKLLASTVGISSSHLQRLFKLCFYMSPKKMQQELRIQKAAELIKEDLHSLEEIAFQLGYTDLPAFSNQFKKHFKTSPSQFLVSRS